jgi:hypothetical protein
MSIYGKDIADTSRTMRAGQRSAVDTGALVGAQYLGLVYGAGVFANGIPLVRIVVRVQWVDATLSCSLLAGVWNAKVFRGR